MSQLSNLLRTYRGEEAQLTLAQNAKLNVRTINRAEAGASIALPTLRALSAYWKLNKTQWAELLAAWLRLELGEDFSALEIKVPRGQGRPGKPVSDEDKFLEIFKNIPVKLQRQLALAAQRDEVLRSLAPLNELYDRLSKRANGTSVQS